MKEKLEVGRQSVDVERLKRQMRFLKSNFSELAFSFDVPLTKGKLGGVLGVMFGLKPGTEVVPEMRVMGIRTAMEALGGEVEEIKNKKGEVRFIFRRDLVEKRVTEEAALARECGWVETKSLEENLSGLVGENGQVLPGQEKLFGLVMGFPVTALRGFAENDEWHRKNKVKKINGLGVQEAHRKRQGKALNQEELALAEFAMKVRAVESRDGWQSYEGFLAKHRELAEVYEENRELVLNACQKNEGISRELAEQVLARRNRGVSLEIDSYDVTVFVVNSDEDLRAKDVKKTIEDFLARKRELGLS